MRFKSKPDSLQLALMFYKEFYVCYSTSDPIGLLTVNDEMLLADISLALQASVSGSTFKSQLANQTIFHKYHSSDKEQTIKHFFEHHVAKDINHLICRLMFNSDESMIYLEESKKTESLTTLLKRTMDLCFDNYKFVYVSPEKEDTDPCKFILYRAKFGEITIRFLSKDARIAEWKKLGTGKIDERYHERLKNFKTSNPKMLNPIVYDDHKNLEALYFLSCKSSGGKEYVVNFGKNAAGEKIVKALVTMLAIPQDATFKAQNSDKNYGRAKSYGNGLFAILGPGYEGSIYFDADAKLFTTEKAYIKVHKSGKIVLGKFNPPALSGSTVPSSSLEDKLDKRDSIASPLKEKMLTEATVLSKTLSQQVEIKFPDKAECFPDRIQFEFKDERVAKALYGVLNEQKAVIRSDGEALVKLEGNLLIFTDAGCKAKSVDALLNLFTSFSGDMVIEVPNAMEQLKKLAPMSFATSSLFSSSSSSKSDSFKKYFDILKNAHPVYTKPTALTASFSH